MYQKPLDLFFSILRLIGFKVLDIELGCVNDPALRFLQKVKCKFQQWNQDFILLDVCRVELLNGERLLLLLAGNITNITAGGFIAYRVSEMIKYHFPAQEVRSDGYPYLVISISFVDHLHCRGFQQQGYKLVW